MTFGKFPQRLFVYLALTTAALAQSGSVLFRLPGAGSGNTQLVGYSPGSSDLPVVLNTPGPLNASQVIPVPHNGMFYVIADGAVQLLDVNQGSFQAINGVIGAVTRARITPDGRYLMVAGDNFYIVNTINNSLVATNVGSNGHTIVDVAFSSDSATMYMLRNRLGEYSLATVDLNTLIVSNSAIITLAGSTLTMSPNGVLYVSAQDGIGEYNVATLERLATILVTGRPGPLRFTPDGTRAYFANLTPEFGGRSIQTFRTRQRDTTGWPLPNTLPTMPRFDDVLIASADMIFALDRATSTLWRIFPDPLVGQAAQFPNIVDSNQVFSAAISNEIPEARFLYLLGSYNGNLAVRRINLGDFSAAGQRGVTGSQGILSYATIPPQFGATFMTKFGENQQLPLAGGTVRIAVRLADLNGRPVYNHPVLFSTPNSNVIISNNNRTTGSEGYAETSVAVPGIPGNYTISVVAASISETFTIRVLENNPDPGGGNGGGGGEPGTGSVRAVRGDGMLVARGNVGSVPLTVEVRDAAGNPVEQALVEFQVISGSGYVDTFPYTTDADGRAGALFGGGQVPFGVPYDTVVVRAHSTYGDVDFNVIVVAVDQSSGIPAVNIANPPTFAVTGTRGDIVPGAFAANITTRGTAQGVPNVVLRLADGSNHLLDGPASCANNTRSGVDGIAVCDVKISCSATDVTDVHMVIGEVALVRGIIFARAAGGRKLTLVSGNNQSGNAGTALNRLVARVTDSCDSPVSGQDVVWTVTQGSATLNQVVSRSGADGLVSTGVSLGNTAGQITVRVSLANASPLDFTLTTNVIVNSVNLISGGGQNAVPGGAFTNPVVFEVRDDNGAAVGEGFTVSFTADKGASLGTTSASTDAQGRVQTTVTAGNDTGTVTVTASVSGKTGTAQLQVRPPTLPIDANSFTNAASRVAGLVPCGLITLVGNGLAPTPGTFASGVSAFGPWQTTVAGVTIRINGVLAPIQVVANQNGVQSVNFQTPCQTQPGLATAVITVNGTDTTVSNVPVYVAQPGIFTYSQNGKTYGAVIRIADGSYITPDNPAPTGEDYYLILTGLGQGTPAISTNAAGLDQAVNLTMIVGVNDGGVPSHTARYLTGNTGIYYIRFTIPRQAGVATGTILRDINLAAAAVINGQAVFGNGTLLPAIRQQ